MLFQAAVAQEVYHFCFISWLFFLCGETDMRVEYKVYREICKYFVLCLFVLVIYGGRETYILMLLITLYKGDGRYFIM